MLPGCLACRLHAASQVAGRLDSDGTVAIPGGSPITSQVTGPVQVRAESAAHADAGDDRRAVCDLGDIGARRMPDAHRTPTILTPEKHGEE